MSIFEWNDRVSLFFSTQIAFLYHPHRRLYLVPRNTKTSFYIASLFSFFRKEMFCSSFLSLLDPQLLDALVLLSMCLRCGRQVVDYSVMWILLSILHCVVNIWCWVSSKFRYIHHQRWIKTCYSNVTKWCRVVGDVSTSDRA